MQVIDLPISNGFYESDSLPISAQQCVNWYPASPETAALSAGVLFGGAGITEIATTGEDGQKNRGAHVKNGIPYFVNGDTLYRLDRSISPVGVDTFSTTALGTVPGSGRVSMDDNGTQLMILVPGGDGFIYDETASPTFQRITDSDFKSHGAPQHVVFIDSYFAVTTDSKKWIISANNDGMSWDALDFGSAESDPDAIVAPVKFRNQLFITGSETTEAFQNMPNGAGFPFVRSNIFIDKGCVAPFSLVSANSKLMMIGAGENESPAIWELTGGGAQKISTTAIDVILNDSTDAEIRDAFAYSYAVDGAYFVGFTVGAHTIEYNTITGKWNERSSIVNNIEGRWRANSLVSAYGKILVGDYVDGRIGELSKDTFTEYGDHIRRVISTQPFHDQGSFIRCHMIELTVESGMGNEEEVNPVVSMDVSDNGKTFKYKRQRSMGRTGEFGRRVIWYRNGGFKRYRIFRFEMSEPVKPVIIKCEARIA